MTTNVLGFLAAFGLFIFVAQYLQLVLGLSPLEAGLWSLPSSAGFIAGAILAPTLLRGVRPAYVIGGGLALAALGFAVISQAGGVGSSPAPIFLARPLPRRGLATELIVGSAPPERAGAASGISETSAEFGGALGIALLGSIGAAVYRSQMADGCRPACRTPPPRSRATRPAAPRRSARGCRRGWRRAAAAADAAFTAALETAALTSAAHAATALLAALLLRRVRATAAA